MAQKLRKCRNCKAVFEPRLPLQSVCDYKCATEIAIKKRTSEGKKTLQLQKRELINEKERIKSRSQWIKEVQHAVNAYVRARDKGKPCISCGKPLKDGFHAGHWKPTSSSQELRFDADNNIFGQCVQCNVFFHGNVANYRIGLIKRIGLAKVEQLEEKHEPKKWTIDQLKELKALYKIKLKELLKNERNI